MKPILLPLVLSVCCAAVYSADPVFKKIVLSDKFYAEGSHYGDFNKDGKPDIVAGPYWYEGPDFTQKHEIYPVEDFSPEKYSDNFTVFGADLNGDGWDDVFVAPHPGNDSYWYENPKGGDKHWTKHFGPKELGNESPKWANIAGQGFGPLYNNNGCLGFSTLTLKDGLPDWTFYPVSNEDKKRYFKYTHGVGSGDINGDGKTDIVESTGWREQPADYTQTPWKFHPFKFADAAAQMLVFDADGDGLNDVITSWHCHLYGLVWWKQVRKDGNITWERNDILSANPDLNSDALRFSQMHALAQADFNGDGLPDFVTGKRFWAHGSKGDKEPNAPAVLYWFELKRDGKGGATFVPHKIDGNSGIGTQVTAADINGDKKPDIIVSNKKGTFVFLNE